MKSINHCHPASSNYYQSKYNELKAFNTLIYKDAHFYFDKKRKLSNLLDCTLLPPHKPTCEHTSPGRT